MIEKFNFYDVYGYFLPGAALIAILWIPFGLVAHVWPTGDWSSALLGVVLAYFLGHLMLYVSTNAIPSYDTRKSVPGKERRSSATLLDADNSDLSSGLREKIAAAVDREFQLKVHIENSSGDYDKDRNDAFFLARQRLILEKAEGYAEQFQGMYSLTRGLVVALLLGAAYYFGWVLSVLRWSPLFAVAIALDFILLLAEINLIIAITREQDPKRRQQREVYFGWIFVAVFFVSGWAVGFSYELSPQSCVLLALAGAIALALSFRCYIQYSFFTLRFAMTVWRDFTACTMRNSSAHDTGPGPCNAPKVDP